MHARRAAAARAVAAAGAALFAMAAAPTAVACELHLIDHRSGAPLLSLPLDPAAPEVRIAFEHSVLGSTVIDRYRFTPAAVLVEEEFDGEGYGLPAAPQPGERLQRGADGRQRLTLARPVDPLVIRPLPSQRMRLLLPARDLLLASLPSSSIELRATGCPGWAAAPR